MSHDLPQEILTDILSRLPVKFLCRFKCVSRSWKTLISSPYLAKTHLNRTKTLKTSLVKFSSRPTISSP
ncbi:hypothetical protein RHMOL_Rhmol10G0197900 [Rhododendron molle]|uniref:Uncharacterized protein n=1 Tax=Rhododendron molle TaxID=49168 RepID=A0ACC0M5R3_RHOML|nr:hypothetical protein RHMOL_Rhmol10G0197900 [Rhododendron molle]